MDIPFKISLPHTLRPPFHLIRFFSIAHTPIYQNSHYFVYLSLLFRMCQEAKSLMSFVQCHTPCIYKSATQWHWSLFAEWKNDPCLLARNRRKTWALCFRAASFSPSWTVSKVLDLQWVSLSLMKILFCRLSFYMNLIWEALSQTIEPCPGWLP